MNRNKLYAILLLACLAGSVWLFYNLNTPESENASGLCLIKNATNIPCPSCGSTRAIMCFLHGDIIRSLSINPVGIIVLVIMITAPLWVLIDIFRRQNSLFNFYKRLELFLQQPRAYVPALLIVIVNWIWNITKGL